MSFTPPPNQTEIAVTLSGLTTATTAYTSGDVLGALVTVTGFASAAGRTAAIIGATLQNPSAQLGPVDVYFFRTAPAAQTDNVAPVISAAEINTAIGILRIPGFDTLGARRVAVAVSGLPLVMKTGASANLTALFVTRSGHTFFSAGLTEQLLLEVAQY